MRRVFLFLAGVFYAFAHIAEAKSGISFSEKVVVSWDDTVSMRFVSDSTMYTSGWDTLPQPVFWRDVIRLTGDTSIINIAYCRKPVDKINSLTWMSQTEIEKICFKDSICKRYGLDSTTNIYITSGKSEFYEFKKALPDIHKSISVFEKNHCDPWYAQAILLIESPGKANSRSYVGAKGPFQLMQSVAVKYGLKVNKMIDERTDLEKSARAASQLINRSCIPYVKQFLNELCLEYNETDLWFRLLVLHVYHAGAGNVRCVIDSIKPSYGGVDLFTKIWQTSCRGFKNESQNYSQIALASLLNFDHLLHQHGDTVFLVSGDRMLKDYSMHQSKSWEAYDFLTRCMTAYETDFLDGVIPFDYFMKRISFIRAEFTKLAKIVTLFERDIVLKNYPSSEKHLFDLATGLTKRKRYEDAICMLKLNLDNYPESHTSYDSIAKLYRLTGDKVKAEYYTKAGTESREKTNKP